MADSLNSSNSSQSQESDGPASVSNSSNSEVRSDLRSFIIEETESLPEILRTKSSDPGAVLEQMSAILQSCGSLSAGSVKGAWTNYLEMVVEPTGWRALLRPSSDTSALLGLKQTEDRRTAILVNVLDVLCDSLEAEVELVRNSELGEEELGGLLTVPIDELYALKQQDILSLNLAPTVKAIDLIRFFYANIWMPWDEDSEEEDWAGQHLQNRVQLHFSLMTGCGDQATAKRLDELMARAELNKTELQELENTVRSDESDEETELSSELLGRLYELHHEQDSIRREAEMLENPRLRAALSSKAASARMMARERLCREAGVLLVWSSGDLDSLGAVVSRVSEEFGGETKVLVFSELQHAIDSSVAQDVVIIASVGEHQLSSLGSLARGGSILARAVQPSAVTITPGDTAGVLLSLTSGFLHLEDVTIESGSVPVSILVSGAELLLKNVTIRGGRTAVLADKGSTVKMMNSTISESETALEVRARAECQISDSVIEHNQTGISVRDHRAVIVGASQIRNNKNYGVLIHSVDTEGLWSGQEAVERASQHRVELTDTELSNNGMGDVGLLEVKERVGTPMLERRSCIARRFSTPMSGKAQKLDMENSGANQSPIPSSLSRVLSFPM